MRNVPCSQPRRIGSRSDRGRTLPLPRWRTVARGEGYTDAEALLSMRAIEGVPFELKDWPSRAIALARRVLLLARTQLVVDADPRPFDVGLEAAAGRWPSLVAWVRAGKEPDAWHRRHNRPPKKTREGRAA